MSVATNAASAIGTFEPSCVVQFLPACPRCRAKHPLACSPPLPEGTCPNCGFLLSPPPSPIDVPATLTRRGVWPRVGHACLAVGRFLAALSQRI